MPADAGKYLNPQCKVFVDGSQLKSSTYYIESVNVQISATSRANSCDVTIMAEYDNKNSCIDDGLLKKIVAGKKVKVEMGYSRTSPVFLGYVNTVSISYSEGGVMVSFSCLDARGLLMGNVSWQTYEKESISQIITEMLKPLASYTEGVEVNVPGEPDQENPMSQQDLDDYQYICSLATLTGSSFCMTDMKLRFVSNVFKSAARQATFKWGQDLLSFNRTVELSEQLGAVTVSGNSPENIKTFSATAKPPSGSGKTGAQLNPLVKGKTKEISSFNVKNQNEAKEYAASIMFESAMKLCTGSARVIGNEKLTPGGKVKFDGLDPTLDGDYYISSLEHSFSGAGFLTTIGFSRNTV